MKISVFHITGEYTGDSGTELMQGTMYVEHWHPSVTRQAYPIVMFHGTAQTSVNWITTPDGRDGWAHYFVEQGYEVYLVDQPARGRSAWHPELNGKLRSVPAYLVEYLFTATSSHGRWPQAKLHTQWPGEGPKKGCKGDPVFDQFYASLVGFLESNAETQTLVQAAGSRLLDRIGPAILLTHSQSGPFGWLLADARPHLVKGIVAVEPNGPPIESSPVTGSRRQLAWGLADIPLTYSPAVEDVAELQIEKQAEPDNPDLIACWQQKEPARQLSHLCGISILILTAESSYHAQYDHATSNWLSQAGVANEMIRLEKRGVRGNGHMVMLEKNSLEIAALLHDWIERNVFRSEG